MPVTFSIANWNDTTFEPTNWNDTFPVLDPGLEELIEEQATAYPTNATFAAEDVPLLEDARYIPLLIVGCLSSLLSILGSGSVLYMILKSKDYQAKHRLIFGLSSADLVSSTAIFLMPFSVPSYLGLTASVGTHASCTATGFFMQSNVLIGCCYNAYLSIYYYLVVRRNWQESDFKRWKEVLAHTFAVAVPTLIGLMGVITQSINPNKFVNSACLYGPAPWGCGNDSEYECTRSSLDTARLVAFPTSLLVLVFSITGFVCTGIVCCTVAATLRQSTSHQFEGDDNSNGNRRLKQVKVQAFLYSLVYFNSFFWPLLVQIMTEMAGTDIHTKKLEAGYYVLQLFMFAFFPLQGALNFFVFTRVKAMSWRKAEPTRSILWIYKQVVLGAPLPHVCGSSRKGGRSSTESSTMVGQSSKFF